MTFRRWMNESRELSKRRMDMLVERFSVQELIEYRDNYARNRQVVANTVMVLAAICFGLMLIICALVEFSVIKETDGNLHLGYTFGLAVGLMLFACPSGSYERKLTKAIEERCVRELELRK